MSESNRESIAAAVSQMDSSGRFPPGTGASLRSALAGLLAEGGAPDHPSELFGPWNDLPGKARQAFRRLVEQEITRVMAYHPRGRIWPGLVGQLYTTSRFLRQRGAPSWLGKQAETWAARGWNAPSNLRERIDHAWHRKAWEERARPSVSDLLAALGRRPRWLLGDFVTGVHVDPRCRGFFHHRGRNTVYGYIIGIDLIPSPDGVWCVEANLNTAYNEERRSTMSPEPAVPALLSAAKEMGARHVWWYDMDRSETRGWLIQEMGEAFGPEGIQVQMWEDHRIPRRHDLPPEIPAPRKRLMSPLEPPEDTLLVRRNGYRVGTDFMVSDKEPFIRAMEAALNAVSEVHVRVPRMRRDPHDVFRPPVEGLPNLVYKYPDFGKGQGVFFLRVQEPERALAIARRLDRDMGEPPGLFQPFVCSRLLPGRRIYDIRCELIVSPLGVWPIFSLRREATRPLPSVAGEGLLEESGVFTSNIATGGRFAPLDPEEKQEIRKAAQVVGEGLIRSLSHTFETVS